MSLARNKRENLKKKCDKLWSEIVKLRAGYKSELSGNNVEVLHSHHVKAKGTYALRYDIRGGICITAGEHFKAHNSDNYDIVTQMREYLKQREGKNIIEILELQKNRTGVKLEVVVLQLKKELQELKMNYDKTRQQVIEDLEQTEATEWDDRRWNNAVEDETERRMKQTDIDVGIRIREESKDG